MSGRYQHNHGVNNNQSGREELDQGATLQRYLHAAGYQTALDGKFLINRPVRTPPPNFDHYAHFLGGYDDVLWNVDGKVARSKQYVTEFQSDRAIEFLDRFRRNPSRPWYLYITPQAPHLPSTPAPRYANAPVPAWEPPPPVTHQDRSDKPDFIRRQSYPRDKAEATRADQLRTLLSVDDMTDRVFRHLRDTGQLDNTLALYVADNGYLYAEYGLSGKAVPYLNSVRVPFFVRWPGHVPAGGKDPRPVGLVDIAPSVLDAAKVRPAFKYPMDGRSFRPPVRRESLLEYYHSPDQSSIPSWASIRSGTAQYIEWYQDPAGSTVRAREYYDLVKDPWQLHNLLGDKDPANDPSPATLADVGARLARYRTCRGTTNGTSACP
jgi:arylsulfatase A-like enzyme